MPTNRPESPAVETSVVTLAAIGLLLFVGLSLVVLHVYYSDQINQATFVPPTAFAEPRLQTRDVDDLAKLQAEQRAKLTAYAWVDREKGIIAIPIEEAMKHTVARGAQAYAPIDSAGQTEQRAGAPEGKQP